MDRVCMMVYPGVYSREAYKEVYPPWCSRGGAYREVSHPGIPYPGIPLPGIHSWYTPLDTLWYTPLVYTPGTPVTPGYTSVLG